MDDVPQNRPQILTTIQYEYFNLEEIYARWVLPFWYSHKRQALPTAIWMSKRSEYLTSIRVLTVASPSSYASVVSQKVKQDFILSRPYYLIEKYPTTPSIYVYILGKIQQTWHEKNSSNKNTLYIIDLRHAPISSLIND